MFAFLRQSLRHWARSGTTPVVRRQPARRRLHCENLEERTLPSVTGSELLVNAAKSHVQKQVSVATSSNGSSVAVWTEQNNSIDSDIKAQRFDRNGRKVGGEILVAGGRSPQHDASVAMDSSGNFAVVWQHDFSSTDADIHAARFYASGSRRGSEIKVASTYKSESDPHIAMSSSGFVISYTYRFSSSDSDVYAKLYSSSGSLRRTIGVAGSTRREDQSSVAMAPDGRFAVGYVSQSNIYFNRYSNSGTATGGAVSISTSSRTQSAPEVAMDSKGNILVAYQEYTGSNWNVLARAVTSAGSLGSVRTVQASSYNETLASIGVDPTTGKFAVAYQSQSGTTGTPSVKVTELSAAGSVVRTTTIGTKLRAPALAVSSTHKFIVAAESVGARAGDPDGGIIARFGVL
jgi:hypothetical protein